MVSRHHAPLDHGGSGPSGGSRSVNATSSSRASPARISASLGFAQRGTLDSRTRPGNSPSLAPSIRRDRPGSGGPRRSRWAPPGSCPAILGDGRSLGQSQRVGVPVITAGQGRHGRSPGSFDGGGHEDSDGAVTATDWAGRQWETIVPLGSSKSQGAKKTRLVGRVGGSSRGRRSDSNRRWWICNPLPCRLATAPE